MLLDGLLNLPWWGSILAALVLTHVTIAVVTIYLHRCQSRYAEAIENCGALPTMLAMRDELVALWERSSASKEQLLRHLQDWCSRAEASGVAALAEFSRRLRSYA